MGRNGALRMKKICLDPAFLVGLLIRVVLICLMAPSAVTTWYVPFLDSSISLRSLDPWSVWISTGGTAVAFPYGYAMWLAFLPISVLAKNASIPLHYGYAITLMIADFGMLAVLHRLLPGRSRLLLGVYWLSPIVIIASYFLGLNDLIPALLLTLSLLFIRRGELKSAGVFCATAISAKLSMIVAVPFFVIYLYNNKSLRQRMTQFATGFLLCFVLLGLPFFFSNAGTQMVFGNPEMEKIYRLVLSLGGNVSVYIVPLVYTIMLYMAWRIRRLNFDLFQAIIGMAFLLIVLMTPASPGWSVWSIPFLVLYQAFSGRIAIILIGVFSALYVLSTLLVTQLVFASGTNFDLGNMLPILGQQGSHAASLLHTSMVAIGIILVIRIWREAISRNDFFRLSRKPFVIGVAGDSGAGKDTFADSMAELFGNHSVVKLSGDDYHLWDRQKPMWQVMTHLNPLANDLERFSNDLISLTDGKSIQSKHYDHQTGKMSKPFVLKSNDFIIASGLHALYLSMLRDCYHLKIYLDIDEGLRRHFKLKRDVNQRGHPIERVLSSFDKREPDSERFIRPQSVHADLTFALQPIHPRMIESLDDKNPIRLKLLVKTKHRFNEIKLNQVLIGVCGLHVDSIVSDDAAEIQMTIEGETTAADIEMAAAILCPSVFEFLDSPPKWQDGMLGLMQLVTMSHISQKLTKRFI